MGRKPKLDNATWEWAKKSYEVEKKSWKTIVEELNDRGIEISRPALSERYRKEGEARKPSKPRQLPGSQPRRPTPPKGNNLPDEVKKLTTDNIELRRRVNLLEGVVELLVKKEIDPTVGTLDTFAICPACGEKSKSVKSHWERRFYCRNKECERKTFIAPVKEVEEVKEEA